MGQDNNMTEVKKHTLIKNLPMDKSLVLAGQEVDAIKIDSEWYKVFHHTGWWQVPAEYFEKEE